MRRTIMITGATSGLGLAMARKLAGSSYELILTCRDDEKGAAVRQSLLAACPDAVIRMVHLDLASFASIAACAAAVSLEYPQIDVLFNNAGLYMDTRRKTAEGFEMTLGVNYLGPYYLTRLLIPLLERGDQPQIISMCSWSALIGSYRDRPGIFENHPAGFRAYLDSKRMQLMLTVDLAAELMPYGITVNAVHPGVVDTGLFRGQSLIMKFLTYNKKKRYDAPDDASESGVRLIEDRTLRLVTGKFFDPAGKEIHLSRRFANRRWLQSLIDRSDEAIQAHAPAR
jgi:NAD(P)-dependent dehydrogenase (short-subunit alcohol dehydrogenase family)